MTGKQECLGEYGYEKTGMVAKCKIDMITRCLEFSDFWEFWKSISRFP